MTEYYSKIQHGYCPEFDDDEHLIEVLFAKVYLAGGNIIVKPLHAKCREANNCQFLHEHKQCPLINKLSR